MISNKEKMWEKSVGRNSKEQLTGLPVCRSGNKYNYVGLNVLDSHFHGNDRGGLGTEKKYNKYKI